MRSRPVWQFIAKQLENQTPVALIAVVESFGASPGKAGFKMAVAASGERCGTIGGGVMEVNWVERTIASLRDGTLAPTVKRIYHTRETTHEQSGLICSGSQTILVAKIDVTKIVSDIVATYGQRHFGRLTIGANDFVFERGLRYSDDNSFSYKGERDWLYQENLGVLDTIYIIGSGHVGLALSRIMATLDFHVVAVDERADVETFRANSYAHEKLSMPYAKLGEIISGNGREYAAVVTTAFKSDEAALKAILTKHLTYVGLMGSDAKTRQIFDDLRLEGITFEQLKAIRTPIGVPIASHTPEEIAISIAAEIIKVKNGEAT